MYSIENYYPRPWRETQRVSPGWTTNTKDWGFVRPSTYANGDIICHKDATPGKKSVKVKAGDILHLQWSHWVPTHHGPMMHYLANAGADFASIDKFKLKWNKIDQLGLIDPDHSWNTSAAQPAGYYAADQLIVQGGRWDFQIPEAIAKGNYVLRAETIAIHSSMIKDGTQHYPQCINIEVTEGGSDHLYGGVFGTELYKPTDPGIGIFNAFATNPVLSNYPIPGPPIHECGQKGYDQTPRFGSAPKWNGPDSAEPYGLNGDYYPVGKIGVGSPNGKTYGNSPAAKTTSSATIAATTTAPAADEYSATTTPAIKTSAQSVHAEVHSSWTSHSFIGTNATTTGTYPTATSVPVYSTPVENSGNQNTGGNVKSGHTDSGTQNTGGNVKSGYTDSGNQNTGGDVKHPGSGYTDSGDNNVSSQGSTTDGTDNNSTGSTTDSEYQCSEACQHDSNGGEHTGGDKTSTLSSATGGNDPTSSSNPASHSDNSGSGGSSTNPGSSTDSNPTSHNGNSGSGTTPNPLTDNSNHYSCPKPVPSKVDSSATPTDESTVAQLLDIIDLCLKKLKAKLANKLRRHARDILRTRV